MPPTDSTNSVAQQIEQYLRSRNVAPTQEWLRDFIATIRPATPIQALQKTALFRILATDLRSSTNPPAQILLPTNITNPEIQESKVVGPVTVQVLDVEDIGRSRWSQVEAIEAQERGEFTKGREVIRAAPDEHDGNANAMPSDKSTGPHKLLLQDAGGNDVFGLELSAINGVGTSMSIGSKLVLKDAVVARGVVLLEPRSAELLGGKIEVWDKKWREERKTKLKEKANIG